MPQAVSSPSVPLCVDLDGTLVKTDTLAESVLCLIRLRAWYLFLLPLWLLRGKAHFKEQVSRRVQLDPGMLPYNEDVLQWLREERLGGRQLLLVTGATRKVAEPVADLLCLFDAIISSDSRTNLTGSAKGQALSERFGDGGFDYAGNSGEDLKVFRKSRSAVLVNASSSLVRDTSRVCPVERIFPRPRFSWAAAFRSLRVYQWVKNLLVFVPMLTSHNLLNAPMAGRSAIMWLAFSLCASGVYIANDLLDLESDRRHKTKRRRSFASGDLPITWGFALAPVLFLGGFGIAAALLPAGTLVVLACYCAVALYYSTSLKRQPLVDVFTLAMLYTVRIWAGHQATGIAYSPWLLSFALFIFLSLALNKRVSELHRLGLDGAAQAAGRGYRADDALVLSVFGVASGFISTVVLSLYINSAAVVLLYRHPILLWLLCPMFLYWICRIWMMEHRGEMHEDPIWFAIRDRVTYKLAAAAILVLLLATKDWTAGFSAIR